MYYDEAVVKKLAALVAVHIKTELRNANGGSEKLPPRLLTVEQAGEYLGRSKQAIEHMIFRGELTGCVVRKDRRVHIDRLALDKWIETHRI
jgi:excisionase family DNA binding protein